MEVEYASILKRVKTVFVDSIMIIAMLFLVSEILSFYEEVTNFVTILIFVFIFFLYEPLLVSKFGGTIGHT